MELKNKSFEIRSPVNGDMLHASDGMLRNGSLDIVMIIDAPTGSRIRVNDRIVPGKDGIFTAEISLVDYRNEVQVENMDTGEQETIEIYRLDHFEAKYRLSIDDNIWFLRDLYQQADKYNSLFDNPFMGFLKNLNERYNTKVHLNIFYETDGFNLSMMPDKYKNDWLASAGWLRLSFHAQGEFPDKPYIHAGYDQVKADCDRVLKEIRRFAGEELTGPVTTIHWGEATVEGSRALRDAGYQGQLGYFNVDDNLPEVSYYLDVNKRRHIKKRFIWKDTVEGIVFVKTSIVIDTKKMEEILPHLDAYKKDGSKPPYLDLLVHEQYFYPFYQSYQPDYCDKIRIAVQWAADNGYTPAFLGDCILDKNTHLLES